LFFVVIGRRFCAPGWRVLIAGRWFIWVTVVTPDDEIRQIRDGLGEGGASLR
jgi:hypothetical protein